MKHLTFIDMALIFPAMGGCSMLLFTKNFRYDTSVLNFAMFEYRNALEKRILSFSVGSVDWVIDDYPSCNWPKLAIIETERKKAVSR